MNSIPPVFQSAQLHELEDEESRTSQGNVPMFLAAMVVFMSALGGVWATVSFLIK